MSRSTCFRLWTWTPRNSIIRPDTTAGSPERDFSYSAIPQFTPRLPDSIGGERIRPAWYNWPMPQSKPINPFYIASLPAGIVFAITACAYVVMTVRGSDPQQPQATGLIAL